MGDYTVDLDWLKRVREDIIDPGQRIIDPHHHLWPKTVKGSSNVRRHRLYNYMLEDFWEDTSSGHNVTDSVYIECSEFFWSSEKEHFNPVGETEHMRGLAQFSQENTGETSISGIIGHANLLLGKDVDEVLERHIDIGGKFFKGIRHAGSWDPSDKINNSHHNPPKDMYLMKEFGEGIKALSVRGLVFEAWQYHHQIPQVTHLAKNNPDLLIILNHFSGPLGVASYATKKEEVYDKWKKDLCELSQYKNVYAKLGGLAMPINGFGFETNPNPPTSNDFLSFQRQFYFTTIDLFGPERCMFESNFPVDKYSVSYHVLWNAFKNLVKDFSKADKEHLFYKTASNVYSIP
ncbi:amidohydrolase family protein [Paracoccaceae bacterium]|nr:amidohydrolase family protein [Paracoccaceae bacterium]